MPGHSTVLITGASRRLGLFLSQHFSEQAWQVIALTRNPSDELLTLAESSAVEIVVVDDYQHSYLDAALDKIKGKCNRIHAVIHNASAFSKDDTVFNLQAYETFFQVHMAMPAQINMSLQAQLYDEVKPGNIIHITDIYVDNPNPAFAIYCSTKAALENLSKGFAKKFAPGIRVNTIQPGPIQFLPAHSDEAKANVLAETLLPYEGGFMPVFQAINSIIENPYITGSTIKVDGGRSLGRR